MGGTLWVPHCSVSRGGGDAGAEKGAEKEAVWPHGGRAVAAAQPRGPGGGAAHPGALMLAAGRAVPASRGPASPPRRGCSRHPPRACCGVCAWQVLADCMDVRTDECCVPAPVRFQPGGDAISATGTATARWVNRHVVRCPPAWSVVLAPSWVLAASCPLCVCSGVTGLTWGEVSRHAVQ